MSTSLLLKKWFMMGKNEIQPASDGKIWAYYDVNTTESATKLLYSTNSTSATMNIDGIDVTRTTSYTFGTTGVHLVKFTPSQTKIYRSVFYDLPRLVEIYFPSNITYFEGGNAANASVNKCPLLRKVQFLAERVTIGTNCFDQLPSLSDINLSVVVSCYSYSLVNMMALRGDLCLPNLTSFGSRSFHHTGFDSVSNLGTITSLPGGANVDNAPFSKCTNLVEVRLPSTLETISNYSFAYCTELKTVISQAISPPTIGGSGTFSNCPISTIYVPAESVQAYKSASGWSTYASKIIAIPE